MARRTNLSRRNFLKGTVAGAATLGVGDMVFCPTKVLAEESGAELSTYLAQCPYCGVGCGSVIKADPTGRIATAAVTTHHRIRRS